MSAGLRARKVAAHVPVAQNHLANPGDNFPMNVLTGRPLHVNIPNTSSSSSSSSSVTNTTTTDVKEVKEDSGPLVSIDSTHPLHRVRDCSISDHGHILGMTSSDDGAILATFSTAGRAKLWSTQTFELLATLSDQSESAIDEFYTGCFSRSQTRLAVAGKRKDPEKWSNEDDDNHILPCTIKVFDVLSGDVVCILSGHTEEVLHLDSVVCEGRNYFVSSSQDGSIRAWRMDDTWSKLEESYRMKDTSSSMSFGVAFLPQTGCRYFASACDAKIKVFDIVTGRMIKTFDTDYSCYCDCIRVVNPVDTRTFPQPTVDSWEECMLPSTSEDTHEDNNTNEDNTNGKHCEFWTYLVARGVETVETVDSVPINTRSNKINVYRLTYPSLSGANSSSEFKLKLVRSLPHTMRKSASSSSSSSSPTTSTTTTKTTASPPAHDEYMSNSWMTRIATDGRYVFGPTYDGAVFIFHLGSGRIAGILRDHGKVEVRDVWLHPLRPLVLTSGDDGLVHAYSPSAS